MSEGKVLVEVVPRVSPGGEIAFGQRNIAEELERHVDDIRGAVVSGATAIIRSLGDLPSAKDWRLGEVSAAFGIVLTAEAGVILTKASVGGTFDVTITFTREV